VVVEVKCVLVKVVGVSVAVLFVTRVTLVLMRSSAT